MKLWGGRFDKGTNPEMEIFNSSISVDIRLLPYEVDVSIAHAAGLNKAGVLNDQEFNIIKTGLEEIKKIKFENIPDIEDVHTLIEELLFEKIGSTAKKLHTGRSRNDLIATDERLYLKKEVKEIIGLLEEVNDVLNDLSEKYRNTLFPGYTHLQRAQPITFSHHLLAYVEMFDRDISRLNDLYKRIDVMPLGSGALAGTSI
jgi:argininosuccinate lyase